MSRRSPLGGAGDILRVMAEAHLTTGDWEVTDAWCPVERESRLADVLELSL